MNIQINFYFFIENLCCCSLKISGASKNCRQKITEWSKNYGQKIPVRACMYARVYARVYRVRMIAGQHKRGEHAPPEHGTPPEQRGTQDHDQHTTEKERNTDKAGKPEYICIFAGTEKKLKKFGNIKKTPYLCSVIKKQSNMKTTKESKFDRFIEVAEYVAITLFSAFMAFGLLF